PLSASPPSGRSTSTRDGCKVSMNGSASSTEDASWMTVKDESAKIRRSPSRNRRLASIKSTESSVIETPPQRSALKRLFSGSYTKIPPPACPPLFDFRLPPRLMICFRLHHKNSLVVIIMKYQIT